MTAAWTRKEGKNPKGGLNAKGRASYKGGTLKAPVKSGDNPRRASFLARMGGMPGPERKPNGEPTRLLLSLQAWGASSKADAKSKAKAISARNKKTKQKDKQMKKVTKGPKTRTASKDHSNVAPIHKPASKPGVGGYSYSRPITPTQDKKYNTIQM